MPHTFTLDIPDEVVPRIIEALIVNYGYQERIADPANPGATMQNPQSHTDFAMDQVKKFLVDNARVYETTKAMREAANNIVPIEL